MSCIVVACPHCGDLVVIERKDINCRIFRHGVHKKTGKCMNPHASKEECERLHKQGLIYGCGKPFRLTEGDDQAVECDYV